jgi:hypothetical protein
VDMHLDDLHRDMVVGVLEATKCGLDLRSIIGECKWNIELVYVEVIGILIICNSLLCNGIRLLDHQFKYINKLSR